MVGKRTYITLICMAIYNVLLPTLGIKEVSADNVDITVNLILTVVAAIFHKVHKPKRYDN